jgi:hypothetical protein
LLQACALSVLEERTVAIDLLNDTGVPIAKQRFTLRELVKQPISKLDDDAYTRVRVILMNGIEHEAMLFQQMALRFSRELRPALADVMRIEHLQEVTIHWLLSPDHSQLDTTIAYEQVAIEVTAAIAQNEPDPYLAQAYRFGLLEEFDHLYRFAALQDRIEGKDANNILQSYTDIRPGRPTALQHRHPSDDLRHPFESEAAALISKLNAQTLTSSELQTHDYYVNIGPTFADPVARNLYAEIATIEAQHVTHYGSLLDPALSLLEQWLLHEANEVYNYRNCMEQESNSRVKDIWSRFLDYELGHLHLVRELFKKYEKRDPAELLEGGLPAVIRFDSQRDFVRQVLADECQLSARGAQFIPRDEEAPLTREYRDHLNSQGSPSQAVAAGYVWQPGSELVGKAANL